MVVLVDDQEMGVGDREGRGSVAPVVEPGFLRGMTTRGERGGGGKGGMMRLVWRV